MEESVEEISKTLKNIYTFFVVIFFLIILINIIGLLYIANEGW